MRYPGVPASLKWPNDVLIGEGKVARILAERIDSPRGPAVVIGFGVNVHLTAADLPVPSATSLALEAEMGRSEVRFLERRWSAAV